MSSNETPKPTLPSVEAAAPSDSQSTRSVDSPPQLSPSLQSASSTSYVYPVRSLLSGIQPAPEPGPSGIAGLLGAIGGQPSATDMEYVAEALRKDGSLKPASPSLGTTRRGQQMFMPGFSRLAPQFVNKDNAAFYSLPLPAQPETDVSPFFKDVMKDARRKSEASNLKEGSEGRNSNEDFVVPISTSKTREDDTENTQSQPVAEQSSSGTGSVVPSAANFHHFPAENSEQTFATAPPPPPPPKPEVVAAPDGTLLTYVPEEKENTGIDLPKNPPISSVAADALAETVGREPSGNTDSVPDAEADTYSGSEINFAEAGLVRLGPVQSDSAADSGATSAGRTRRSEPTDSNSSLPSPSPSSQLSVSDSNSSLSGPEPLVTVRFEHVQNEHGHHVVIGREGTLTRCEDEPIRIPGAVQGFGVLIALEEDDQTGNLVVRQVSENAEELLGLPPQYLFSLDCFSQTLPDSQADILFDNVQFLNDPDLEVEGTNDDSPQVFLLSGWGAPGTALFEGEPEPGREHERREWTCWCAAHRPPTSKYASHHGSADSSASSVVQNALIVLEFELERDFFNPLYPPFAPPQDVHLSGDSSPGTGTGSSTDGSTPSSSQGNLSAGGSGDSSATETNPNSNPGSASTSIPAGSTALVENPIQGLAGEETWYPTPEEVFESTTSRARPLRALERMRRISRAATSQRSGGAGKGRPAGRRGGAAGVGTMDVFAVLAQVNDQLGAAPDLDSFLKVVVGVIKDLTQFHRVLVYQFDEQWNGQAVAELVDWNQTHDLYKGLHFPASDIPAQARELYTINKVRLLYDRAQTTARLVVRSAADLEKPLDMTHAYLRAMSPIHIKYLANMGVKASMSISIITFGQLWGLIACHSYGQNGMRVSFPVRQMLRLLSDSISRNIERLSYAQRLHTRKLISTLPTDQHPTGYIVSNAEDLLGLFDADFGVLVIGEGAKILGPNQHGQEILIVAEYLRLKQFNLMQVSQSVIKDFPDLQLPTGLEVIAGLLYVPLSSGGKDFIALLRKGQLRDVHWAGKPFKEGHEGQASLEPRKSFKMWSETIAGRCRAWTDEQLETAGVLALVYGKFIEVWRQKESALQTTQLTNLLLSNASHEVRTPLNHIINYLELALNGPLDVETRENLSRSHIASKSLLFTINDLLDLTRLESGNETSFNEPFDLQVAIEEAVHLYRIEATRREIEFKLDTSDSPKWVVGDAKKIRTVVANLTANAVKYTQSGGLITVESHTFKEPTGLRDSKQVAVEIVVGDTGCGIPASKLESIFREFEQVESSVPKSGNLPGLGLGLAVVARIVEQLGGQLRVDSKPDQGSRFSFLIPFALYDPMDEQSRSRASRSPVHSSSSSIRGRSRTTSEDSGASEIDSLVEALSSNFMAPSGTSPSSDPTRPAKEKRPRKKREHPQDGTFPVEGSNYPVRSVKVDEFDLDKPKGMHSVLSQPPVPSSSSTLPFPMKPSPPEASSQGKTIRKVASSSGPLPALRQLRVLIVEDDNINRTILSKRLTLDGHVVVGTTNGQEAVQMVEGDRGFDCILMDIQMPILNGFEATERIRAFEKSAGPPDVLRLSHQLNGRIPIFAVSASLVERQREYMIRLGMDGWILKPIDYKRMNFILAGIVDLQQRNRDVYSTGCSWERGGWLEGPPST